MKGELAMRIGAQLYTVREYTQTLRDFADTIKKIAAIGYECVQISAVSPEIPPQEIAETCKAHNLEIIITHTKPARILDETEVVIEEHKMMGAKYVGIGMIPDSYSTNKEGFRRFITDFIPAARAIKEADLQLMYHNHHIEFERFDGVLLIDYMKDKFHDVSFTLDTFWVQAGGADPALWIENLAERVDVIHLKDYAVVDGKRRMAEVMEGNLNWPAIMKAAAKAGVKYGMVEQDDCYENDPFECLRHSLHKLKEGFPEFFTEKKGDSEQ